jgi:D-glycero-alpha-D-manno-heptose-7-phosphate kinase
MIVSAGTARLQSLKSGTTDRRQRMNSSGTIRARVPLRLDLAGSGTDLSPYCDEYGGVVLNATIDRYAYAFIERSNDGMIHFAAPDLTITECHAPDSAALDGSRLPLHVGVTRRMAALHGGGVLPPISLTSYVDAPPGSGLGSTSALVVALVSAFAALYEAPLGPYDVAHLAFEIERLDLQLAGGKQDQYAATFGGTNYIEFQADDRVIVNPLRVAPAVLNELETSLVVCLTSVSPRSTAIIIEQQQRMTEASVDALEALHQLKRDAIEMKDALLRGQIARMAEIFNRSWLAKKQTASGVSTGTIDTLYDRALASGATGGKVSGAGGGGMMMFIVPPDRRFQVIRALMTAGAMAGGVHFTSQGAESWVV